VLGALDAPVLAPAAFARAAAAEVAARGARLAAFFARR
jgi:hypothetical protein